MSDVPEGYKMSEVGVIPEEWEVKPFVDIVNKYIDYRGRTPKKLGMNWGDGEIISLSANNVQMGYIDFDKDAYFGSLELYKKWMTQGDCQKGDILLTMEAPLGNVAQIPDERRYILSQRVILIRTSGVVSDFLFHLLSGAYFQGELLKNSSGSTAQGIQRQKLDKILIYIPNSPVEQTAIASALSDVDALITALEQLIIKKRNIKQGTMQQLLTSKKRLPGFSGEWEVKELNYLCNCINDGTHHTPKYVDDGVPFYSVENVTANNFSDTKYISQNAHNELIKRCKPEKGDILLTRIGTLGKTKLVDWDVNASIYVSLALLKVNDQIDKNYFYQYTKSWRFVKDIEKRSLLNAVPQKINMEDIGNVRIKCPPTIEEQQAIAQILSDMDTEIEALEQKRDKYKAIKQGMMQELLTGKRRLA